MMEIENWMKQYCGAVRAAFGDRVRYIGLQGSRGRGEAGPDSDIDVVCILDSCSLQDLETYRAAVKDLPDRDKLCGFVSGTAELAAWDRGELFQFRRDTTDWCGRLADLLPPEEPGDARRALHQGVCGLYHLCCHNFLHGRSREAVAEACIEKMKRFDKVYITFDIDALDPGFAAGTGTPQFGGLTPRMALTLLEKLFQNLNIIGFDVVEIAPPLDPSLAAMFAGRKLLQEVWGYWADRIGKLERP